MADYLATIGNPEKERIRLRFPEFGVEISDWLEYSYNESYLVPCDGWTFRCDASLIGSRERSAFYPGAKVVLDIDGKTQSTGYLDRADFTGDRSQGNLCTLSGRDILRNMVSGGVDPLTRFTESQTLADILTKMFAEFGITNVALDNEANRNIITGANRGVRTSKRGRPLRSFTAHQTQPFLKEGAYQFCERLATRFGLRIRPSADGNGVVVAEPDFDQAPIGRLVRKIDDDGDNNILSGGTTFDMTHQPAAILAIGEGGGGEFARASLQSAILNPLISADLSVVRGRWPKIPFKAYEPGPDGIEPFRVKDPVVIYEQDTESHTAEQLEHFLYRRMSEFLRQAVVSRYTIEGHTLGGFPLAVDTVLDVVDERSGPNGLAALMWVMERTFRKARESSGSTSTVHLIPLNTLVL